MTKQPATPETDAVWGDKSQNILEHARRLERELAAERALADRLAGYICDIHDVTSSRKLLKITMEAWETWWTYRKEARSE